MGIRNLPNEQNFFSRKRTEQSRRPNFARFEIFLPPNKENVSANWHILEESLDSWTSLGQEDNSPSPPQIKSVDGSAHVRSLHFSFLVSIAITMTSLQPDCPPTSAAPDLTMYHHNKRRRHEESSSITKYLLQHPGKSISSNRTKYLVYNLRQEVDLSHHIFSLSSDHSRYRFFTWRCWR